MLIDVNDDQYFDSDIQHFENDDQYHDNDDQHCDDYDQMKIKMRRSKEAHRSIKSTKHHPFYRRCLLSIVFGLLV